MWSGRVLAKYWAMQLPEMVILVVVLLAARHYFGWPDWVVWAIVAAWVAKDASLYPFVWRAYDPHYPTVLPYPGQGAKGVAVERIDPNGLVRIGGEIWYAELVPGARAIEKGEPVRVNARYDLTLQVEPEPQTRRPSR